MNKHSLKWYTIKMHLIYIYRTFHPQATEYIFFSSHMEESSGRSLKLTGTQGKFQ